MNIRTGKWIVGIVFLVLVFGGFSADPKAQEGDTSVLASRIMDQDVYGEKENRIGEVDDIILRRSGRVKKVTVEFDEWFWDIGGKLAALPFKKFSMEDGKVFVAVTEEEMEERPVFSYYQSGLRTDYYYRVRPYTGFYRYPHAGYYYDYYGPGTRPTPPIEEWARSPSRYLASTVMDRPVINEEGMQVGWVKDLLINSKSNKVEKIIVLSEDILGKGNHAALPYKLLGFTAYGIVYDITRGQLEEMPTYSYPE